MNIILFGIFEIKFVAKYFKKEIPANQNLINQHLFYVLESCVYNYCSVNV